MTRLPEPELWTIHKMNEMEAAEMLEEHIDFVDENGRSVHLPMPFVRHYMTRHDDALPTLVAIATLPIVLGYGKVLAMHDDLDELRGIWFKIPIELLAIMPKQKDCTPEAVKAAMQFLLDDWLCDVTADFNGKCTLVAACLTVIERSLLPERPVFFITSGRRGCGKTTTLTMLIMAVMGMHPAAAAWSTNEEERRKALLSYFLAGVPYIIWDNISRGSKISCPHVEKSCSASYYSDRKLGVSETVATAASTIHFFTGNNISPRGDLASRTLQVQLQTERADPENRDFRNPDPVGWTRDNRAEILKALYTILLGNPVLKLPEDAAMQTRFKMWWRMVGSAVEHGARQYATGADDPEQRQRMQEFSFKKLFITLEEEEDEDTEALVEALQVLHRMWPDTFKAADVASVLNSQPAHQHRGALREFLYPGQQSYEEVSAKSVGWALKRNRDNPVTKEGRTLTLKVIKETGESDHYRVEVKDPEEEAF